MSGIQVLGPQSAFSQRILTADALAFLAALHRNFDATRKSLLRARVLRQRSIDSGVMPGFLEETRAVREGAWQVAPVPADLQKRWVEITGPTDAKSVINALNSGADMFMADFEDALSPTWENVMEGQDSLYKAVRRQLELRTKDGKTYKLKEQIATLMVRPRGWHLLEQHVRVDGEPMSASLFDFGLYFFHNAAERVRRGTGVYFYLPKMESHLEARLWNDVFVFAQRQLAVPQGSIRCTVLIETILGGLEMEEILYELKDHIVALNAGRWDYMFSVIKKFRRSPQALLPDRSQLTMTTPFMRAYTERLVHVCHKHGAHAIGGMSAFIPSRKDADLNAKAMAKVTDDKEREVRDGFDGTWVAHPDLVPVARAVFAKHLGARAHQKDNLRADVRVTAADMLNFAVAGGQITEAGARMNVNVALQYINAWLQGVGAAAIHNLMEDAATAEISRAQLWQWLNQSARLADGRVFTKEMYQALRSEELAKLGGPSSGRLGLAAQLLDQLVLSAEFADFLTTLAYDHICHPQASNAPRARL